MNHSSCQREAGELQAWSTLGPNPSQVTWGKPLRPGVLLCPQQMWSEWDENGFRSWS